MDSCKESNESQIYWNRNTETPPNQQIYRFNSLLNQLESLEEKMFQMNQVQMKEIKGVSEVVKNSKQGMIAEIGSTRDQLLLQIGEIVNSIGNFRQVEDKRYKKEKKYLESIIKKVKKSDKKHSSYENQTMEALSQLIKSVNEVLLHQGETDEQLEQIKNEITNYGNIGDIHHSKDQESLKTLINIVTHIDEKQMSHENQTIEDFSELLKSVEEVQLSQGETDKRLEQIKNEISNYSNIEDNHHNKEQEYLETIINIVTQLDEKQMSYENKAIEALAQLLTGVDEVQSSQGEADEQLKQIKNEISSYGSLEEINHRKEKEYFETILKQVNQLDLKQMSHANQASEVLSKLLSKIKEVYDNQGLTDEQLEQIKNQLSSYRNIDECHHRKEQEYLESISNQINKINKNQTSFENQASIAYSGLLSKFEEANTLHGATDYQLKRISDNFSDFQNLEATRYEKEQKDLGNIYSLLNKLDEKHTSFEIQTVASHAHISNQLEEIHTLQGEVIKLFEKINSTIIKLLATLPTGKKISSVTVKGSQLELQSFINFDEETNMATFQHSDGSLVVVDSRQILAITFPSSL
ncbi:hypothetical protein [Robertmurraya korlensis]|uniref:hypothetical protein n=1 Tax=Robertmurraya korlensis TaxID=519977 RepID=UPI000825DFF2|nr:hypothetical protein [Robertmurraya korlensis]